MPDQAELSAGVVTQGPTAADALAANSRAMNAVFDALKKAGIAEKSIQTSNFSVSPQYTPYKPNATEPPRIVGYQVSNNVTVKVDDLDEARPRSRCAGVIRRQSGERCDRSPSPIPRR